ncbi:hypothetical protein BV20DRAFT_1038887 [Pilatotrama ljubarskyi]|nr:hypothetical protein BV20DRAFT_1038887 [Pilatotrama ljubarskyi]
MLDDLERLLNEKGIRFHRTGNRLRCFPHVVNISVQHGLRALGCGSSKPDDTQADGGVSAESNHENSARAPQSSESSLRADPSDPVLDLYDVSTDPELNDALQDDPEYMAALFSNPLRAARTLIAKARQSGPRREEFAKILTECIRNEMFGEGIEPSGRQLLRDVDTRWSSTFLMLDRLLSLYPAVQLLMRKHDPDALLSDKTLDVLADIREFLAIPHAVQELLSAENAPTASLVLRAYTDLIDILKDARSALPRVGHGIQAAISALEEYMAYTRQTRVYALAMSKSINYS